MAKIVKKKKEDKAVQRATRLVGLTLVDVTTNYSQQEPAKDPEAEYEFFVGINRPNVDGEILFFLTNLSVQKRYKDQEDDFLSFGASYFCGVKGASASAEDNEAVAKKYAETTVWGAFSALCAIGTQQMGVSFPALPPAPGRIDVHDDDIEIDGNAPSE